MAPFLGGSSHTARRRRAALGLVEHTGRRNADEVSSKIGMFTPAGTPLMVEQLDDVKKRMLKTNGFDHVQQEEEQSHEAHKPEHSTTVDSFFAGMAKRREAEAKRKRPLYFHPLGLKEDKVWMPHVNRKIDVSAQKLSAVQEDVPAAPLSRFQRVRKSAALWTDMQEAYQKIQQGQVRTPPDSRAGRRMLAPLESKSSPALLESFGEQKQPSGKGKRLPPLNYYNSSNPTY
mmetsp:Transcript_3460/g.6238  ORF Transcript_3460/g.6238 Transcript_3460/m.6238 type:complete len:231 (+) Transcript_3460:54-746(+)